MSCESCGRENQSDSRFCSGCGTPLILVCAQCERELAPDARFCDGCGQPVDGSLAQVPSINRGPAAPAHPTVPAVPNFLPSPEAPRQPAVRKTVTALFCDLVGSTAFGEQVDAESARDAMGRYFEMARRVVEANGGTVSKFIGDGVLALFGVPEMAEDDAARAVQCGLALQVGFEDVRRHIATRHGIEVGLRVGINTGEVVIAAEDEDIVGDALNTAARLEAACPPGRVLVGEPTWRLTRSVVKFGDRHEIRAKGKEELVGSYEVLEAIAPIDEVATPFVGRDAELRQLRVVLEDTILDRTAKMVTIIGSPGVGKTRLAREMRAAVDGGTVAFELRCERSGGATFAPISELLRSIAGITDAHSVDEISKLVAATVADFDDAARVGGLLAGFVGAAPMRSTEEMFFAVRRLFEMLGSTQPVVFVVDDIQWAEPLFLDLLEHLVEWVRTVPLLVVGLARPEIRDLRPALTETGRRVALVVNLEGLSNEATSELAAKLVGAHSLPRDLLAKIPESTEGNPLFVRELMRMLVDDGVISNASGTWQMVIDIDAVEVPTINSLLASRVERMAPGERRLLELASVVGSEFPVGAVQAAGAVQSRAELELLFERLRRRELIEPTGTYWGDEPVFRFHHVLIRDAAYRRLLKGARAELHVLVGEWTEETASTLVGEHEVAIAHHFEQAHHYRHQLDLDDYETRALGERAASLLQVAATRALSREDLEAAGSLATRALACVDDQSSGLSELLVLACESLLGTRNVAAGAPLVDRLAEVAGTDRRLGGWVECFRAELAVATDPDGLHDAELRAEAAAVLLEELGDQAGVAKARAQRAAALARLGRVGECEEELDQALTAARAIDDRRRVTAILGAAPVAALWGPSPVPRAGGRCLDVVRLLRITTGSPAVEATSVRCQAVLEALRGRYDTARTMLASARDVLEELGQTHGLLETELYSGLVELLAQDAATAEPFLRRAYDGLGLMGIGADAGQAAAHLARALLVQGRIDEAADLAAESDALAGQNPQTAIISHSVQAEVLAGRGSFAEAIVIAEKAVELGASTDILVDHANAAASLARVLNAAGHPERAAHSATEAARLFEMKGAAVELSLTVAESAHGSSYASSVTLAPEPGKAVQFWNRAHERATGFLWTFVERDEAAYSDLVADDVVIDDRRPLVQLRSDGKGDVVKAAFFSGSTDLGVFVVRSSNPVAVRGESLALMSNVVSLDDHSVEVGLLAITQWSDEDLLRRIVRFDPDDLAEALAELDRLYESELSPFEALTHSEYADHNLATAAKDIDGVMCRFDPSMVVVDHRQIGWPSTDDGWTQIQQRATSLFESVESVVAIFEKTHRAEFGGVVNQHRYVTVMADGAAPSQRDVILIANNPASGYTTRIEQFDELDVDSAVRRFDELAAAWTDLDTAQVVHVGGAVSTCVRSGKHDRLESFVASGFVLEDSEGEAVGGDDLLDSLMSVGFGGPDRTVVAVRCDRLSLTDTGLGDGSRCFSVEEIDEHALLVRIRRFSADQLADAFHYFERQWTRIDESIPAALVGPLRQFLSAVHSGSAEAHEAVLHESFEFVDHNLLGAGTASRSEFINLRLSDSNPSYVAVEQLIHRTSSHGMVSSGFTAIDGERVGDVVMSPHVFVLVFEGSLARRLESFPEDQLDAALARFDELDSAEGAVPEPVQTTEFWNKAHESASGLLTMFVERDEVAYAAAVADEVVTDDRRSLVQLRLDGKRDVVESAFFSGSSDLGAFVVKSSEPVAVRGESLVLMSTVIGLDDDSVEFGWLGITQWSDEGLQRRMVLFDPDDLVAALAELDRLHQAELPPAEALYLSEYTDHNAALAEKRIDDVLSRFDPSFEMVDHRQLGWPATDSGFDQLAQRTESLVNVGQSVVSVNEKLHRSGAAGALWAHLYNVVMTDGSAPSQASLMISMANPASGYLTRFEQFDEQDIVGALGRYDELVAERTALDTSRVVEVGGAMNICLRSGKHDRLESFVASGFVLENSERDAVAGDDLIDSLNSVGFGGPNRSVVAVRGDRLALIDVGLGDGSRCFLVEEIDQDDLLIRIRQFSEDQLREALAHLDNRWTELDSSIPDQLVAPMQELSSALLARDTDDLDRLLQKTFECVDHRLLGVGRLSRSDFVDLLEAGDRSENILVEQIVHKVSESGFVSSGYLSGRGAELGDIVMMPKVSLILFDEDKVSRIEFFPEDQFETALARLDELDSHFGSKPLPIDLSPELVNSATRLIEGRWAGSGSVEVLAVRFDEHALAEVTVGSESFLILQSSSAGGVESDEQRLATDSLPEALHALDRRWIDGLGSSATKGLSTFVALIAALNPLDADALAALYATEMKSVSHASLLQLAETESGSAQVDLNVALDAESDSIVAKAHRIADHLVLSTFMRSDRRPGGGRWVSGTIVLARESEGQVDYFEYWDADDVAAANTRFDELAADLAAEADVAEPRVLLDELRNAASEAFSRVEHDNYVVIAVRDQLALLDVIVDGEPQHYVVVEADRSGQLVERTEFGDTELSSAMDCINDRWFELFPHIAPENGPAFIAAIKAITRGDIEQLSRMLKDDFKFVDRRKIGFGELDRDGWLALREASADFGVPVQRYIHRSSDAGVVASMTIVSGHHGDDLVEAGVSIAVAMFKDGLWWRYESFDEDEVDAALARFDELAAIGSADPDRLGAPDLSPDLVNTASRLIEERWSGSGSVEVLAVRFDDHALAEVTADSESFLILSMMAAAGAPNEQRFDVDELAEAMRSLDSRWIEGLGSSATEGLDTFAALMQAMNPPDPDALASLYDPDLHAVSHASLNQLAQAETSSEQLDFVMAMQVDNDNIAAKVTRVADHLMLAVFDFSNRRPDGGRWVSSLLVLARENGVKIDYFENWDVGDMAAANARFDELASELATERSAIPTRSLEVANAATERFKLERPGDDFEVVSGLYQNHALVEVHHADGPEFVYVTLTSEGELMTRSSGDRLIDGIKASYRGWIGSLDEQQRPAAKLFMEFGLAHHPPVDADPMAALLAEDFEVVAHNHLGALDNATAEEKIAGMVDASDVMGVAIVRKLVAHSDHVMLTCTENTHEFAGSDRWGNWVLVLVLERDGLVAFQEQWDVEDLDAALARFDELAAATDAAEPGSPEPLGFRMTKVQRVAAVLQDLRRAESLDLSQLSDLYEDEVVYDDRRSLISAGRFVGKADLLDMTVATRSVGLFDDAGSELIALRGDSQMLGRSDLVDEAGNRIERLFVVSLGPSGKLANLMSFDIDDLDTAYDELDRLYCESLPEGQRELFERQGRAVSAVMIGEVIRDLYSPDFSFSDHRLLGLGLALDLDGLAEVAQHRPSTLGVGSYRLLDHEFVGSEVTVLCMVVETTSPDFAVEASETSWSVIQWRAGRAVWQEMYNPNQRVEAFSRAREMASIDPEPQPMLANACTRNAARQVALFLGEYPSEPPEGLFSPEFVLDDRRSTVNGGVTHGSAAIAASWELFGGVASVDDIGAVTLAIRGDRFAMVQVVFEINEFVLDILAVESIDMQGRRDRTVMFDHDDIVAAEAELDRLWTDTLSKSDADLVRRLRESGEGIMFGDSDKVGTFLSSEFVATDSRTLGWGTLDRAAFLQIIEQRPLTIGDGYFMIPEFILRDELVHIYTFEIHTTSREFGVVAESSGIGVGRVSKDGSGLFDRFDTFDDGDMDRALARAEELAAESG